MHCREVVECRHASTRNCSRIGDWRAIDHEFLPGPRGRGDFDRVAHDRLTAVHGARPGVSGWIGRKARGEPGQVGELLAHYVRGPLAGERTKGPVGEQDPAAPVQHDHTFGHDVEGERHALGDHGLRIQMDQRAADVLPVNERSEQDNAKQGDPERMGECPLERAALVRRIDDLEAAPALAAAR